MTELAAHSTAGRKDQITDTWTVNGAETFQRMNISLVIALLLFLFIRHVLRHAQLDSALLHLADGCRRISSDPDIIIQASLIITSVSSDAWLIAFTYDRGKFLR